MNRFVSDYGDLKGDVTLAQGSFEGQNVSPLFRVIDPAQGSFLSQNYAPIPRVTGEHTPGGQLVDTESSRGRCSRALPHRWLRPSLGARSRDAFGRILCRSRASQPAAHPRSRVSRL